MNKIVGWINFKFFLWLAGKLPRWLIFWSAIRATAEGKNAEGQFIIPDTTSAYDAIVKWRDNACYERAIWGHSQNLTDDWGKDKKEPMWKHGRAWLHIYHKVIHTEWGFGKFARSTAATITVGGGEHEISFHLCLSRLFSFWLSFEHFLPAKWFQHWDYWGCFGRSTGIRIFDGSIWIEFFHNDDGCKYHRIIPGISLHTSGHGGEITIDPMDLIFGYSKHTKRTISTTPAVVTLPEGQYPVTVEIFESSWKRPRLPKVTRLVRAEVDCGEKGIPAHAGKGENDYDLDDDFTYGMTCPASTPDEAVKILSDSILRDRKKYGMPALEFAG